MTDSDERANRQKKSFETLIEEKVEELTQTTCFASIKCDSLEITTGVGEESTMSRHNYKISTLILFIQFLYCDRRWECMPAEEIHKVANFIFD